MREERLWSSEVHRHRQELHCGPVRGPARRVPTHVCHLQVRAVLLWEESRPHLLNLFSGLLVVRRLTLEVQHSLLLTRCLQWPTNSIGRKQKASRFIIMLHLLPKEMVENMTSETSYQRFKSGVESTMSKKITVPSPIRLIQKKIQPGKKIIF